jgi:hypothetical protein
LHRNENIFVASIDYLHFVTIPTDCLTEIYQMSVILSDERATQLVDAAKDLGNRLSYEDAAAGVSAIEQLKAQGLRHIELSGLRTWTPDQRALLRSACRVAIRGVAGSRKRRMCEQLLREVARIEHAILQAGWHLGGFNPRAPVLSERAWIEANGY